MDDFLPKSLKGIGVYQGIAIGRAYILERKKVSAPRYFIESGLDVENEIIRFNESLKKSREELYYTKLRARGQVGPEYLQIIDAHMMILEEDIIKNGTLRIIKERRINAEWAFENVIQELKEVFNRIDDDYFKDRRADLDYVAQRVLRNLLGIKQTKVYGIPEDMIIVAHDLSPADTIHLTRDRNLAFVTDMGTETSHTAILARAIEIPAVLGTETATEEVKVGNTLIVDGGEGLVIIEPDPSFIEKYNKKKSILILAGRELERYASLPAVTLDDHRIDILANIELPGEVNSAIHYGADGIGLYRTEFIYLDRKDMPSEKEHFETYKNIYQCAPWMSVNLRTMDLGGDKFISHLDLAPELNPSLGLRAIRFCLKNKEIFKVQLRGMIKASAFGKLRVMFPMISHTHELKEAKSVLYEVMDDLKNEGVDFDRDIKVGIMIEIPSAVLNASLLAKEVDFFSIGTNDLIQYTFAIDRVNEYVAHLYQPLHPVILHMIKQTIEAGHGEGIEVGLCGEMAGIPIHVPILIGMGVDNLSMNPYSIPRVKKVIRAIYHKKAEEITYKALEMESVEEIKLTLNDGFYDVLSESDYHHIPGQA